MRFKLTLLLFFLNVLVFGTIFFLERGREGDPARARPEPILPSSITQSDRIEVTGSAIPFARVLVREGGTWHLEEPVQWRANPNAIERIFRSLLFLRQEIRFTIDDVERNNQTLADYGLDQPVLELIFERDGESMSVRIGSATDVGGRFYLLGPSGEEIFVVDEEVLGSVALDIQDLSDQNLFFLNFFAIKEWTLQPGNGRNLQIRLATVDDGWRFEAPIQTEANSAAVDSRLQAILETTVGTLYPENTIPPSDSGLAEPRLRISLEDGNRRQTFLLGKPIKDEPGKAFGKLEGVPTVAVVPEGPFLALDDAQKIMRERAFFQFDLSEVGSVRIVAPEREVNLQKLEDDSWRVASLVGGQEPARYPADPGVLARMFESLISLRAVRFVSDAPSDSDLAAFGLLEPQRRVVLGGDLSMELLLGDLDVETKTLYAKVAGKPFVYAVPLDIIRELPVSVLAYRDRLLDALPESARISSVQVVDFEDGGVLLEREIGADGRSWTAAEAAEGTNAGNVAFASLLQQLREFRVESFFSASFGAGIQLDPDRLVPWRYGLRATVELPGSEGTTEIVRDYSLTERIGGTMQGGGSEAGDITFLLPQGFVEAWSVLFPERELPALYDEESAEEAGRTPAPDAAAGETAATPDERSGEAEGSDRGSAERLNGGEEPAVESPEPPVSQEPSPVP